MANEEIPASIEQRFHQCATAAIMKMREVLIDNPSPQAAIQRLDSIVLNIYVDGLRETFQEIAREEFRRVARETVRETIMGVFDKVWRNS